MTMTLVKVDPVWQPLSQQRIFRDLLTALSFPGRVLNIAAPLAGARAELGILASLVDEMVTVADPDGRLSDAERRLLVPGALAEPDAADNVLCDAAVASPAGFTPRRGTIYRPEAGALLVLACGAVGEGDLALTLTGPGVETETVLRLSGVQPGWIEARQRWCDNFPTGVDLVFCDAAARIAGVPRTSGVSAVVERKGDH
jgi:alpha-D-ribose 1-methylphosphonate 5-triphosphate synthase subunit PhnH